MRSAVRIIIPDALDSEVEASFVIHLRMAARKAKVTNVDPPVPGRTNSSKN